MIIEFRGNPLTATEATTVSSMAVPRVGEVIETSTHNYLVHEVFYTLDQKTNTLTPVVYCHEANLRTQCEDRNGILQEHGWLHLRE